MNILRWLKEMAESRVFHFRLNPDDEDERRALEYIERLEGQGYNIKQILLPAILQRANIEPVNPLYLLQRVSEMLISIDDLKEVVSDLKNTGSMNFQPQPQREKPAPESNQVAENDPMMQALMKRAKPGKRFDT